jgi:hypothetical protein
MTGRAIVDAREGTFIAAAASASFRLEATESATSRQNRRRNNGASDSDNRGDINVNALACGASFNLRRYYSPARRVRS